MKHGVIKIFDAQDVNAKIEKVLGKKVSKRFELIPYIGYLAGTDYIGYYTEEFVKKTNTEVVLDLTKEQATQIYPKVMEVCNDENFRFPTKRVVFMEKDNKFIALTSVESLENIENEAQAFAWKFARDIQDDYIEVTLEEIAKWKNVDTNRIKIKQ